MNINFSLFFFCSIKQSEDLLKKINEIAEISLELVISHWFCLYGSEVMFPLKMAWDWIKTDVDQKNNTKIRERINVLTFVHL